MSAAVLLSEWTKLRSLWSIRIVLAVGPVLGIGLGALSGWSIRAAIDRDDPGLLPGFDPVDAGFGSLLYAQLAFVAFAVLVVSSEYGSGTIRSSLAAVPVRERFYIGKMLVVGAVAAVAGVVTAFTAFPATEIALGRYGVALSGELVPRVLGGAVSVTLLCVLAAGVAAMLRNTALSLGVLIPFFFVVSPVLSGIDATSGLARHLPDQAGMRLMGISPEGMSAGVALVVMVGWAAAAVLGGYLTTRRRDV